MHADWDHGIVGRGVHSVAGRPPESVTLDCVSLSYALVVDGHVVTSNEGM